jgi:hypothetical protein
LIRAASAVEQLPTNVGKLPTRESHVRPLLKLENDAERAAAWQAMNVEAERKATEVRLRAERRAGELMAPLRRTPPAEAAAIGGHAKAAASNGETRHDAARSEYAETLDRAGIPRQTAHRWQQLAAVPAEQFVAAYCRTDRRPRLAMTTAPLTVADLDDDTQEMLAFVERARTAWGRTPIGRDQVARMLEAMREIDVELAAETERMIEGEARH